MQGSLLDFKDLISKWFLEYINEDAYNNLIKPILFGTSKNINQQKISSILLQLKKPYKEFLQQKTSSNHYVYSEIFCSFIPQTSITSLYLSAITILSLNIPKEDLDYCLTIFLQHLSHEQKFQVLQIFPACSSVFIHLADYLIISDYGNNMIAFLRLFQSFDLFTPEVHKYVTYQFRKSLKMNAFKQHFEQLVQNIVEDPHPIAFDVFFSSMFDGLSFTLQYWTPNILALLKPKINMTPLPISYLEFLYHTNALCILSSEQIWSYVIQCPLLLFKFIERSNRDAFEETWKIIIERATSLERCDQALQIQINVFLGFLVPTNENLKIFENFPHLALWFRTMLDTMQESFGLSELSCSFLTVFLMYCRLSESFSRKFLEFTDPRSFFDRILKYSNTEMLSKAVIWLLEPNQPYPFQTSFSLPNLKSFSFSFVHNILSAFISKIIEIGGLVHIKNELPQYLIEREITLSDKALTKIAEEDENFFIIALSADCNYEFFKLLFFKKTASIENAISFFSTLVSLTPIVNDYLYMQNSIELQIPSPNHTLALWVKFLHQPSTILTLYNSTGKLSILLNSSVIQITDSKEKKQKIHVNADIDGWKFLTITFHENSFLSISTNLSSSLSFEFSNIDKIILGSSSSSFALQSVRVCNPKDIKKLFALGPNFKNHLLTNVMFLNSLCPFIDESSFFSYLYLPWLELYRSTFYHHRTTSSSSTFRFHVWTKSTSSSFLESLNDFSDNSTHIDNLDVQNSSELLEESNSYQLKDILAPPYIGYESFERIRALSFFECLEPHGGISLFIHYLTEVILKYPDLQSPMMVLMRNLFNKAPFVHYFFKEHSVYISIGQLLFGTDIHPETLSIAAVTGNGIISNTEILEHWLLGAPLSHFACTDLIESINKPINYSALRKAKAFELVVQSLSISHHNHDFLKILISFCISLTNSINAKDYAQIVFNELMQNHLVFYSSSMQKDLSTNSFSESEHETSHKIFSSRRTASIIPIAMESPPSDESTRALIGLLNKMLETYPEIKNSLHLELLVPALYTLESASGVALAKLLLRYLPSQYYYIFAVVLQNCPPREEMNKALIKSADSIFNISIALLYLSSDPNNYEQICDLLDKSSSIFLTLQTIPSVVFEILIMSIFTDIRTSFLQVSVLHNTIAPKKKFDGSEPFYNFLSMFIVKAISLYELDNVQKFFEVILSCPDIPILKLASISLYVLGLSISTLNNIFSSKDKSSYPFSFKSYPIHFIKFAMSISTYILKRISMTPIETPDELYSIVSYFVKCLTEAVCSSSSQFLKLNKSVDDLILVYLVISLIPTISSEMSQDVIPIINDNRSNIGHSLLKKLANAMDRLDNPTMYSPFKMEKSLHEDHINQLSEKLLQQKTLDIAGLQTICCNAIKFQTDARGEPSSSENSIDSILRMWHKVFTTLFFPGSLIFQNCPVKYRVFDNATVEQQRRMLCPMNPSLEPEYKQYWSQKYGESSPIPKPRLVLKQIVKWIPTPTFVKREILFSGDGLRLSGINLVKGIIILTAKLLKFYERGKSSRKGFYSDLRIIKLADISEVRLNMYQHQPRGIIIVENNYNYSLFAFGSPQLREDFIEGLQTLQNMKEGQNLKNIKIQTKVVDHKIQKLQNQWVRGEISNFDYILALNLESGRVWSDFTQFPVFPWTLTNFSDPNLDLHDPNQFRNLSLPFFAQTEKQQQACQKYYSNTIESEQGPHHIANYISNISTALYFLVRIEPYSGSEIDFQGGTLDHPDRTFFSFEITTGLMNTSISRSVIELVPEAYFLPEMLENVNNLIFKIATKGLNISNVILPPWASSPDDFIHKMRKALESDYVSEHLNEWIDLIWGYYSRGNGALEKFNVMQKLVYDYNPDEFSDNLFMMKAMTDQMHNCGQAPPQLFFNIHPQKSQNAIHKEKKLSLKFNGQFQSHSKFSNSDFSSFIRLMKLENKGLMEPSCWSIDNEFGILVIAHSLPLITCWNIANKIHLATLRGNVSKISCVTISKKCNEIISGHIDGKVSVFCMNPYQFIRIIEPTVSWPITHVLICEANANIVIVQSKSVKSPYNSLSRVFEPRNTIEETKISLWSVNGKELAQKFEKETVRSLVATDFPIETRKNYILILNKTSIIALSARSLKTKFVEAIGDIDALDLKIKDSTGLILEGIQNDYLYSFINCM